MTYIAFFSIACVALFACGLVLLEARPADAFAEGTWLTTALISLMTLYFISDGGRRIASQSLSAASFAVTVQSIEFWLLLAIGAFPSHSTTAFLATSVTSVVLACTVFRIRIIDLVPMALTYVAIMQALSRLQFDGQEAPIFSTIWLTSLLISLLVGAGLSNAVTTKR